MRSYLHTFLIIFVASTLTFYLSSYTNPVFSASLFGLIFGVLFRKYAGRAYCGCFIGMSSSLVMRSLYLIFLASMAATILWFLFRRVKGYGGKLGFIAFLSILLVMLPSISKFEISIVRDFELDLLLIALAVLTSLIALKITYFLRKILKESFKESESVIASALTGLTFGFIPFFIPEFLILSEVAHASSFAGMSSLNLIEKGFVKLALITTLVYVFAFPLFPGFGGKLGTIAFISVILYFILSNLSEASL